MYRETTQKLISERLNNDIVIDLPLLDDECIKKNIQNICVRISFNFAISALAECWNDVASFEQIQNNIKKRLLQDSLYKYYEHKDKIYLESPKKELSLSDRIVMSWEDENLRVLTWAVSLTRSLPFPTCTWKVNQITFGSRLYPANNFDVFMASCKLRTKEEILSQVDLHYCLDWLKLAKPEVFKELKVNSDVLMERRRALEWLVSEEGYYDVSLDT